MNAQGRRLVRKLVDFAPVVEAILRTSVDRVVVVSGRPALEDVLGRERRVVFALNHGPPHLPVVPVAALQRTVLECGGGDLRAVGIMFRGLYLVPALARLVRFLTQTDAPPSFRDLLDGLTSGAFDGVVVMPEGANCFFGAPCALQPFASPRFVELAARVDAPIVLAVHRGLEGHARELGLPRAVQESELLRRLPYGLGRALARTGRITLPSSLERLPELRMAVDVHRPSSTSADLEAMSEAAAREWVEREAAVVHEKMVALHQSLR